MTHDPGEPSADEVAEERQHLFNLAYRMFGSATDAEDAVRQTYARWYALPDAERSAIAEPRVWLTNTAGRLCLTALASARPVREEYPGQWLPEPVPGPPLPNSPRQPSSLANDRLSLDESVTMGLLVVLESLSPAERVAFVLHDVFGMSFGAVGSVVGRTAPATRELAENARRRIHDRGAHDSNPDQHTSSVHNLRLASQSGRTSAVAAELDPAVVMVTDGGTSLAEDSRIVRGAADVAQRICDVLEWYPTEISEGHVNGQSGLILRRQGDVAGVVSVNVRDSLITDLWVVLNPDKLKHWNRPNS